MPVPNSYSCLSRTSSASWALKGDMSAYRMDQHRLTVSLFFPTGDIRHESNDREGVARALENLCIARAEQREDQNDTLRLYPPELYCRRSEKGSGREHGSAAVGMTCGEASF